LVKTKSVAVLEFKRVGLLDKVIRDGQLQISSFAIMKLKAMFCCETTHDMHEDCYIKQSGRGIPVLAAARYQRGHGLGSIVGGHCLDA